MSFEKYSKLKRKQNQKLRINNDIFNLKKAQNIEKMTISKISDNLLQKQLNKYKEIQKGQKNK